MKYIYFFYCLGNNVHIARLRRAPWMVQRTGRVLRQEEHLRLRPRSSRPRIEWRCQGQHWQARDLRGGYHLPHDEGQAGVPEAAGLYLRAFHGRVHCYQVSHNYLNNSKKSECVLLCDYRASLLNPAFFAGMILEGPMINLSNQVYSPFRHALARAVRNLLPEFPLDKLKLEDVTSDQEMQDKLSNDPLRIHEPVKLGMVTALFDGVMVQVLIGDNH